MIKSFVHHGVSRALNYIRHGNDQPVQGGLCVTPAQMLEMTRRGIPITPQNLGLVYQEGVSKLDFEPPLEYQRGVDIGTMWEAKQDMRRKFRDAVGKLDLQKGGE